MSGALSVLAGRLSQERARSGRAALDLAVYRREFERVQHSFSRLEEFVGAQSLFKPMLLFEYPAMPGKLLDGAGPTAAAPPDTAGVRRLVQVLPVDSLGVSGFAIYFHAPPPAGAALQVTLTTMENEQCFATWSIGAADVRIGWLQLALSHAIDQPALSLVVTVELPAGFTYASLALGQPHPYEEFCARSEGATFGAPLALRVFGGLPGVRVTGGRRRPSSDQLASAAPDAGVRRIVCGRHPGVSRCRSRASQFRRVRCRPECHHRASA